MPAFRIVLALLIALALPMQALAAARTTAECCPLSAEAAPDSVPAGHDCCHEDTAGKTCDAGTCCPCGAHPALGRHGLQPVAQTPAHFRSVFMSSPQPAPPDAHWRPPARLLP